MRTYDMFISCFQVIFLSSIRLLLGNAYNLYENNLTLFYRLSQKWFIHKHLSL